MVNPNKQKFMLRNTQVTRREEDLIKQAHRYAADEPEYDDSILRFCGNILAAYAIRLLERIKAQKKGRQNGRRTKDTG